LTCLDHLDALCDDRAGERAILSAAIIRTYSYANRGQRGAVAQATITLPHSRRNGCWYEKSCHTVNP